MPRPAGVKARRPQCITRRPRVTAGDATVASTVHNCGMTIALTPAERRRAGRRAVPAVAFVIAALSGAAFAGPIDDAYRAYTRGDYTEALKIFVPLA